MTSSGLYIDGKPVTLGKRIGRGGEGDVYVLANDGGLALKLYTVADGAAREPKITAMLRARLAEKSSLVAFPLAIARRQNGSFAGFVMKLVGGHKPFHELYSPGARKHHFPHANYPFLVRVAANLARAVAQVHAAGCVIGDINHSGVLISDKATAALIDADSFQIIDGRTTHHCRVGVPEYTPPELQGVNLASVLRTANHDAFGLAISIFLLLFMGRHPYVGVYSKGDMPIQKAIAEHRFAYSQIRNVGMTPPPGASDLTDLPKSLQDAFEAAFSPSASSRPTAARWVELLDDLERNLAKCRQNTLHHFPKVAKSCPWCDMENYLGLVLFLPHIPVGASPTLTDPGEASFNLREIWATIEAVPIPDLSRVVPIVQANTPLRPDAIAVRAKRHQSGNMAGVVMVGVAALALTIFLPQLWFITLGGGALIAGILFNNKSDTSQFNAQYRAAGVHWDRILTRWKEGLGVTKLVELRRELGDLRRTYEGLNGERQTRIQEYESNRRASQLDNFLDNYQIRAAKIKGIGPAKTATLASFGVETAADVDSAALTSIPGFGPVNSQPLLAWRAKLESKFVYNPSRNALDQQELQKIQIEHVARAADLRTRLINGMRELANGAKAAHARLAVADPELANVDKLLRQLAANLDYLGLARPTIPVWPLPNAGPVPRMSFPPYDPRDYRVSAAVGSMRSTQFVGQTHGTIPTCPNCGGKMIRRVARRGHRAGKAFWGCLSFPACHGTRPI